MKPVPPAGKAAAVATPLAAGRGPAPIPAALSGANARSAAPPAASRWEPRPAGSSSAAVARIAVDEGLGRRGLELSARARELLRFQTAGGSYILPESDLDELRALGVPFRAEARWCESELPVAFQLACGGAFEDPPPEVVRLTVIARLLAEGALERPTVVEYLGRRRSVPPDAFVLDRPGGQRRYVWRVVPGGAGTPVLSLAERYPNLRAQLSREDARLAISLGSGGLKIFSHVPLLRFLERIECAQRVDEFWGCSAGALVALLYCHGLSPEAIEQTGYDLYAGRYRLDLRPSRWQLLSGLARELFGWTHPGVVGAGFVDCARSVTAMIEHYCRDIRPVRPLYCLAYNLELGRTESLTPEPVPEDCGSLLRQTGALEAALASSAVPLFFVPRRIEDADGAATHYIDGSTTEDVPLHSVVRKWDLDRAAGRETRERLVILSVKLTPRGVARIPAGRVGKLRLVQTVASAAQEANHRRDLEMIASRPDVELISLQLSAGEDFFEVGRIPDYVQLAKEDFGAQLEQVERELAERARDRSGLESVGT